MATKKYDNIQVNVRRKTYEEMAAARTTTGKSFPVQVAEALEAKQILDTLLNTPLSAITLRHLLKTPSVR